MKFVSTIVSTAISVASTLALLAPVAHADSTKMASLAGRYTVKSCQYTLNYKKRKKDYYCRAKEFTLIDNKEGGVELKFIDELNQDRPDIVMSEYKKDQKDGTLESANFDADDYVLASWTWNLQGNSQSATDRRTFSAGTDGVINYKRYFTYYNNSTYKTSQWDVELVKVK